MPIATAATFLVLLLLQQAPVAAQTAPTLSFEVASVKRNASGTPLGINRVDKGRVTLVNVPLRQIILIAYRIQGFELAGGAAWIDTERFDVTATTTADAPPEQVSAMLQTLLADRFKLRTHRETRDLPIYHLVRARSDGRLGTGLKPAATECDENGGYRVPPPDGTPVLPPGFSSGAASGCRLLRTPGWLMAAGQPMAGLATALTAQTGTRVIDRTGIAGNFDFSVRYLPDSRGGVLPEVPPEFPRIDPDAAGLFTAIQEQLGVKLESARGPADVLVIDAVDPPTDN